MENTDNHIGGNPSGIKGILIGYLMNILHKKFYSKIVERIQSEILYGSNKYKVLDAGCGGGQLIKILAKKIKELKIYGIDHSEEMVRLSKRKNRNEIKKGIVEIVHAKIEEMEFDENEIDVITAFDTINLWKNLDASIKEIKRILKNNGYFVILNAYPKEQTKWWEIVKFKNDIQYKEYLEANGFTVDTIEVIKRNILIIAKNKAST